MTHKQEDWNDVTIQSIQCFFSHPDGYLKRAAAMMLADRIIPGMHEVMSDEFVGDRETDHSYRIFLALERENA